MTAVLNADEIRDLIRNGHILNADLACVNAASLDIRLGDKALKEGCAPSDSQGRMLLSLRERDTPVYMPIDLSSSDGYTLRPNECLLVQSVELFNLPPNIAAVYKLKSSMSRMMVDAFNAGWCDPGWNGSVLSMMLKNQSRFHSVHLDAGVRIGQIVFLHTNAVNEQDSYATKGSYNGLTEVSSTKPMR